MEQKLLKGTKNVQANKNCAKGNKKRAEEQKMCKGQNEDSKGHMEAKCYLLWHIMVLNCCICVLWPCMAYYGLV